MKDKKGAKDKLKSTEMPERMTLAEAQKHVDKFKHIKPVPGFGGGAAVRAEQKGRGKRKR